MPEQISAKSFAVILKSFVSEDKWAFWLSKNMNVINPVNNTKTDIIFNGNGEYLLVIVSCIFRGVDDYYLANAQDIIY